MSWTTVIHLHELILSYQVLVFRRDPAFCMDDLLHQIIQTQYMCVAHDGRSRLQGQILGKPEYIVIHARRFQDMNRFRAGKQLLPIRSNRPPAPVGICRGNSVGYKITQQSTEYRPDIGTSDPISSTVSNFVPELQLHTDPMLAFLAATLCSFIVDP